MTESIDTDRAAATARPPHKGPLDLWHVIAVLVFVVAGLITFREVLRAGPMSSALVSNSGERLPISEGDVIFEAWLTARNARTLMTAPQRLFDTPHCAPATKTLTLGVPMVTMGVLAIPAALFTTSPAFAYNFATWLLFVLSALAMYLLVREWTGVAAAGIVAGLLYAFNPLRVGININHPSVWDSTWLVFALYFSQRLFARGRWRDAMGLALAGSLQIGASFYPLLAAVMMAPAFGAWLLYRYGFRNVRWIQLATVFVIIAAVAALLFGPYLEAREAGEIGGRLMFYYARWFDFLPGGALFLGWGAVTLGLVGLLLPRGRMPVKIAGDPRPALFIGAFMTTAVVAGPNNNQVVNLVWPDAPFQIPNLYLALGAFVPGLDSIRGVLRLVVATQVAVCIFAGLGAAWLIDRCGKRAIQVGAGMIVLAMISITPEPFPRQTVEVRADPVEILFYERLEKLGNDGPILEAPLLTGIARSVHAPGRILLSAYHHRRTSTCFGSFRASGGDELADLVRQLPEDNAIDGLRELGFTTLVVNKRALSFIRTLKQKLRMSRTERLPLLLANSQLEAYGLRAHRPAAP